MDKVILLLQSTKLPSNTNPYDDLFCQWELYQQVEIPWLNTMTFVEVEVEA